MSRRGVEKVASSKPLMVFSRHLKVPPSSQPVITPSPLTGPLHLQPLSDHTSDLPITLQKGKCYSTAHSITKFTFYYKLISFSSVFPFSIFYFYTYIISGNCVILCQAEDLG